VVDLPQRDGAWGVQGTGRWVVPMSIVVAYLYAADLQIDSQRIAEDIEALTNKALDETTQPSGVVILAPGLAATDPILDSDSSPVGVLVSIPLTAQYAATAVEA
jgi:hypothetical protein